MCSAYTGKYDPPGKKDCLSVACPSSTKYKPPGTYSPPGSAPPPVVSRDEWGAGGGSWPSDPRKNAIVIHHTVVGDHSADGVRAIDQGHAIKGFGGIGYHYVIDENGTIYEGRPIGNIGTHVEEANTGKIGIALIGNYSETKPKTPQLDSMKSLVASLQRTYSISNSNVYGHQDINKGTECPGQVLYDIVMANYR